MAMEPPPGDDDGADLGISISINHDDSRYEPLPPHNPQGSGSGSGSYHHHPASHVHHLAPQQPQQPPHMHHGGGSGGQQHPPPLQQHPEQQHHQHHPLISSPPHHYLYHPNYTNYAHHPQTHPHHHHHAAAAMNYQTYASSSSTFPPTQYHHPAATAAYHPYDASSRLGAAATTAGSAAGGAITTAAVAYPQYPTQEQPHLQHTMQQQPEYLHQQQQQISYHHRYYPPLPPRHLQQHEAPSLPPPHPLLSPPIAGYDVEPKDEVGHLKQQIRQSSMEQEQQQHPQDEDEQHAPSLSQKEIEASSDITLNQTTTNISMPDSTTNGLREEQKESQQQQHEKKEVMSDDRSPDAAATTTTTVNTAVDASEDAELLIAVESKKNEKLAAEEESKLATATTTTTTAAANTTTCEMGQSPPLPENEVATNIAKPPSSSQAIVDDDNDAPKHTTERVFPFDTILTTLQQYETKYHTLSIPTTHPSFIDIVSHLVQHGIEDESDMLWERNFKSLQEYKDRVGDCDVPFTTKMLGPWVVRQRELYAKLQPQPQKEQVQASFSRQSPKTLTSTSSSTEINKLHTSRFQRLSQLGFDFTTPMWDVRLQELISYKSIHQDCSPPVSYPKLGIWTINQRFNLKDMPKERVEALDALGFVWNHNRKNRSQKKWDGRYEELCEYQKETGHCNVPATYRHSPLGTWVGKQREEYKKLQDKKSSQLDKYRIDKLNEIGFQWTILSWTTVSWEDRFEALKKYKEQHGHVKIPRNDQEFGNWPLYQKTQYKLYKEGKKSKLTKDKVDKLIQIGFLESDETPSLSAQATAALVTQKGGDYDAGGYDGWYQSM